MKKYLGTRFWREVATHYNGRLRLATRELSKVVV